MIKIGIKDTQYIRRYGVKAAYRAIRAIGYDCVDFQRLINTDDELYKLSDGEFAARLTDERKFLEDCGLEVYQTHGPWRYPPRDGTLEERAERFEKMSRAIWGTSLLGSRFMVIHPIMPWGTLEQDYQSLFEVNVEFMSKLAEVGRTYGVIVCLENMPMIKFPLATPEECLKTVRAVNSPWLKICLDTGHCATRNVDPADAVRQIGKDLLMTLHVHDNDTICDCHWVPFTGRIDWLKFANALQETGFDGCLSLECAPARGYSGRMLELQEESLYLSAREIAGLPEL